MIKNTIIVALGGSLGSVLRYLISSYISKIYLGVFPLPTFIINLAGCILIGLFIGMAERFQLINTEVKLFLITGFCGGFTTFSTFSSENLQLFNSQNQITLLLYIISSVIIGILGVWLGHVLSRI